MQIANGSLKERLEDDLIESRQRENKKDSEIEDLRFQNEAFQKENERLKLSLANKDSQNQGFEEQIRQERERRENDGEQLRNLLMQEREKSLQAAREAERYNTEIQMYSREADNARRDLEKFQDKFYAKEEELLQAKSAP